MIPSSIPMQTPEEQQFQNVSDIKYSYNDNIGILLK